MSYSRHSPQNILNIQNVIADENMEIPEDFEGDLISRIDSIRQLRRLGASLRVAKDLEDRLGRETGGPYTIFAPSNSAFTKVFEICV